MVKITRICITSLIDIDNKHLLEIEIFDRESGKNYHHEIMEVDPEIIIDFPAVPIDIECTKEVDKDEAGEHGTYAQLKFGVWDG